MKCNAPFCRRLFKHVAGIHTLPVAPNNVFIVDNKSSYVGSINDNQQPHGKGHKITERNGIVSMFCGIFNEGAFIKGSLIVGDLYSHTGHFENGKPHGRGSRLFKNGTLVTGIWENGFFSRGVWINTSRDNNPAKTVFINYANNNKEDPDKGVVDGMYVGPLNADGERHGEGHAWTRRPDGMVVSMQGTFENNKFTRGTAIYGGKYTYTGTFVDRLAHEGTRISRNGDRFTGTWHGGRPYKGKLTGTLANGNTVVKTLENGRAIKLSNRG